MLTKNQELELRRQAKQTADKYIPDPNAWGRRYSKRQILPVSYESLGLTCDRFDPDGVDLKQQARLADAIVRMTLEQSKEHRMSAKEKAHFDS